MYLRMGSTSNIPSFFVASSPVLGTNRILINMIKVQTFYATNQTLINTKNQFCSSSEYCWILFFLFSLYSSLVSSDKLFHILFTSQKRSFVIGIFSLRSCICSWMKIVFPDLEKGVKKKIKIKTFAKKCFFLFWPAGLKVTLTKMASSAHPAIFLGLSI